MEVLHNIEDILYGSVVSRLDHGFNNNCTTFLDRNLMALDTSIGQYNQSLLGIARSMLL